MTTYAKYADMYRQRLARSQDARLELSASGISPIRRDSQPKVQNQMNHTTIGQQQSTIMLQPGTIQSPRSMRQQQQPSTRQSVLGPQEIPSHVKLAHDRSAYMTFLEVQLERVTQACTNTLSFQDKVEALNTQVNSSDEKVQNIGRLVKLLQSFSEAQEEDVATIKVSLKNLAMRIDEVAAFQHHSQPQLQYPNINTGEMGLGMQPSQESGAFGTLTNNNLGTSISPAQSKRSLTKSKSRSPARNNSAKKTGTIGERVSRLEGQVKSMNQGGGGSQMHYQSNSFGTLDPAKMPNINQMKDDLNNFASEVDKQMRDVEARIVTNLSQHVEESSLHTNAKIDEALLLLDQKVSRVEQMNSAAFQRPNVIQSTQIIEDGRINPAKMEEALNDWLSRVEEQVNQIEEQVHTRAAQIDLKSLERRLFDSQEEKEVRFSQLEQYCQRMVDQGNSRYEEIQERTLDWEDRFLQIQRQVEINLHDQSRSFTEGGKGSLLQSALTSQMDGNLDLSNMRTLEKKLAKRLGEGVERLGEIIKDLAKAQRKLDTRTSGLELKVFGQIKTKEQPATVKSKKTSNKDTDAQSTKQNSKKASNVSIKPVKSGANLKNSNNVKSPTAFQPRVIQRRSQKSLSPPVKQASQDRVGEGKQKRGSSSHRRLRSKHSMGMRSQGAESSQGRGEKRNSASARQIKKASLNNFRTSFEQRLIQDSANEELSPREILRRARDRTVRELSQSFNDSRSRSRSPHSQRLQSLVDIETASPHQHRLSASIQHIESSNGLIQNGPASGQKNILAPHMSGREFEMEQFRQRGSQGQINGREYLTYPQDINSLEAAKTNISNQTKQESLHMRKNSNLQQRSNKGRKVSREARSASRDNSRDKGYTLQDLERREKSLAKKLAAKMDQGDGKRGRSRTPVSKTQQDKRTSKERSLSQRTFQKMNAIGQNTLMQGQGRNHDLSYSSQPKNQSFNSKTQGKKVKQADSFEQTKTISPNKHTAGQLKTTKSTVAVYTGVPHREIKARRKGSGSAKRVRSRSASGKPIVPNVQTAAQEIFNAPFEYNESTHGHNSITDRGNQPSNFNSRRGSNSAMQQTATLGSVDQTSQQKGAGTKATSKRQRSISQDRRNSHEETKKQHSLNTTTEGKKLGLKTQKSETPNAAKKAKGAAGSSVASANTGLGAASKTAKQKLKNLQNKKSNQRLAKLEKMYQELTEIEAKTSSQL